MPPPPRPPPRPTSLLELTQRTAPRRHPALPFPSNIAFHHSKFLRRVPSVRLALVEALTASPFPSSKIPRSALISLFSFAVALPISLLLSHLTSTDRPDQSNPSMSQLLPPPPRFSPRLHSERSRRAFFSSVAFSPLSESDRQRCK